MPAALWIVQTTVYRPALVNLWRKVTLAAVPDLKPLPETLCGTLPDQCHTTVVPFETRRVAGTNFSPRTPTFLVAPKATLDRMSAAVRAATAIRAMSFLTEAPF